MAWTCGGTPERAATLISFSRFPGGEARVVVLRRHGHRRAFLALGEHDVAQAAAVARVVVERLEEEGGAVAHDAVDPGLEADQAQPVVAEAAREAERRDLLGPVELRPDVDARRQLALPPELLVGHHLLGRREVLDRRHAALARLAQHRAHLHQPLLEADRGNHLAHEVGGRALQDSRSAGRPRPSRSRRPAAPASTP